MFGLGAMGSMPISPASVRCVVFLLTCLPSARRAWPTGHEIANHFGLHGFSWSTGLQSAFLGSMGHLI